MSCRNDNCNKNPLLSKDMVRVSIDGDFVCNAKCKADYDKQKDYFFNVTVHSEELTKNYLLGKDRA